MGCGNSKVENSARRPAQRGRGQAGKDDEANDNNNNNNEKDGRKSQATLKSNTKSNSNRKQKSNLKGQQNKGDNNNNDDEEKKRTKIAVNEKGYKKRLRENLRNACAGTEIEQLDKHMVVFNNNKLEDGGDYSEAQDRMEYLVTRKEIKDACMRNHPVVLDSAIKKVEASQYKRQLKPYLDRAYYLKQNQNEQDTFRHDISNMEQSTISEIRSYNHPPDGVHETMIATYMICGYPEEHLTDWSEITALMGRYGKDSLIREVQVVDQNNIDKNTALRARHYLGKYSLEEVRSVSNGAAAFYVWSSQMVGKQDKKSNTANSTSQNNRRASQQTTQNNSKPVTPADAGRYAKNQKQQSNTATKTAVTNSKNASKATKK